MTEELDKYKKIGENDAKAFAESTLKNVTLTKTGMMRNMDYVVLNKDLAEDIKSMKNSLKVLETAAVQHNVFMAQLIAKLELTIKPEKIEKSNLGSIKLI